jgi:hypothetical protein
VVKPVLLRSILGRGEKPISEVEKYLSQTLFMQLRPCLDKKLRKKSASMTYPGYFKNI